MAISLSELEKALSALAESLAFYKDSEMALQKKIARDACIQRFEFSVELAWKMSAKVMGSKATVANIVMREMAQNELIPDPVPWFEFIRARNLTLHTYDESVAERVFAVIADFHAKAIDLLACLKARAEDEISRI